MKKELINICLRVVLSTVATAVAIYVLLAGLNWIWVLRHFDPSWMQETLWHYYQRSMFSSAFFVTIQIGTLFAASIVLAMVRRRHNPLEMLFSGLILLPLDYLASTLGFLPDHMLRCLVYYLGFPLITLTIPLLLKRNH